MKNYKIRYTKLALLILSFIAFDVNAQKLPNVQENSLWFPKSLKVDGKATEWDGKFQAYNKKTDIFYTVANDDDNLYLIVQAKDPDIIKKIIVGGLTFTVISPGKKNEENKVEVTFPVFGLNNGPNIALSKKPQMTTDTIKSMMQNDSFKWVINKELTNKALYIGVDGIKAITDSTISVYNDLGIETAALFDDKINYTYELNIPIKYLGLSLNKQVKLSYNIRLAGITPKNARVQISGKLLYIVTTAVDGKMSAVRNTPQNLILAYPTDFSGQYTLAKK
jgi:hypothetical protein